MILDLRFAGFELICAMEIQGERIFFVSLYIKCAYNSLKERKE